MKINIKKLPLSSKKESTADLDFWRQQSKEYKLQVLEAIRKSGQRLTVKKTEGLSDGNQPRLRRVLRVIKQQ